MTGRKNTAPELCLLSHTASATLARVCTRVTIHIHTDVFLFTLARFLLFFSLTTVVLGCDRKKVTYETALELQYPIYTNACQYWQVVDGCSTSAETCVLTSRNSDEVLHRVSTKRHLSIDPNCRSLRLVLSNAGICNCGLSAVMLN